MEYDELFRYAVAAMSLLALVLAAHSAVQRVVRPADVERHERLEAERRARRREIAQRHANRRAAATAAKAAEESSKRSVRLNYEINDEEANAPAPAPAELTPRSEAYAAQARICVSRPLCCARCAVSSLPRPLHHPNPACSR